LATWTATPGGAALDRAAFVPVEEIAATTVAPIGSVAPVLLIVLDGCGLPTFVELAEQFDTEGFRELARGAFARRTVGIAALPRVTEVSRASLLAGTLDTGGQDHERRRFASNPSLQINGRAAALFHQNVLRGPAGQALATGVRDALGPDGPAVVG